MAGSAPFRWRSWDARSTSQNAIGVARSGYDPVDLTGSLTRDSESFDSLIEEHSIHPLFGLNRHHDGGAVRGNPMKSSTLHLPVLSSVPAGAVLSLVPLGPAEARWVFLAREVLGRIKHMTQGGQPADRPGYDLATVILEAPADRVFATAVRMARKNPAVRIVSENSGQRRLQVAEGDRTATLNVVSFSDDVSQLLIAGHARPGEGPTASLVVQAVLRVCREMGKHCEVGGG